MESTDRILKTIRLAAPQNRVWRAVSTATEFGAWFGMRIDGEFEPGAELHGTVVDPPGFEDQLFPMLIETIEPQSRVVLRWHPYPMEPGMDYASEPMTTIEFRLRAHGEGTELTIEERGFDAIPAERRAEAYRMNSQGWAAQLKNIQRYVEHE